MAPTPPATSAEHGRGRAYRAAAGDGDRLRTELIDAAERELIDKGSAASVSLRNVARTVGVSATSVYLHFADKDELLLAVCSRRFEEFVTLLREVRAAHETPSAQLLACGRAYVRFGLEHPEQYQVLFGHGLPMELVIERLPPEELFGLQALEEIASIVAAGMASGDFRTVDPFDTAVTMWALVHGLVGVIVHGHDKPIDADHLAAHSLQLLMVGLAA